MDHISITNRLQVFHLKNQSTDLSKIGNRRFMYHPSGTLILGDETKLQPGSGLYASHAIEHGLAEELIGHKLPPFDSFCRGWIGTSKQYSHGLIHFAPPITTDYLPHYNTAFDFIEISQKNGFTENTILRGFCDEWEQPISHMLGHDKPSLDNQIKAAGKGRAQGPSKDFSLER